MVSQSEWATDAQRRCEGARRRPAAAPARLFSDKSASQSRATRRPSTATAKHSRGSFGENSQASADQLSPLMNPYACSMNILYLASAARHIDKSDKAQQGDSKSCDEAAKHSRSKHGHTQPRAWPVQLVVRDKPADGTCARRNF